jgi:hypothetical protein
MHKILYGAALKNSELFELAGDFREADTGRIPVMEQAVAFLTEMDKLESLKATQTGNLPRAFVLKLYADVYRKCYDFDIRPNKESDLRLLTVHKHLLKLAGLIRFANNKFTLTQKARALLAEKDYSLLYRLLFFAFVDKFNWGFQDFYDELPVIQHSTIFGFHILRLKARNFVTAAEIGALFYKAFPDLAREVTSTWETPEENIMNCYRLRFLQRFCHAFGLVDEKVTGEGYKDRDYLYKTTEYFDRFIKLKL